MGADPTGTVSRIFGVYDENTGLAFRGTFIINPDGMLAGTEVNLNNVGRNADELVRKVKAFIYVREHPAEVCPAKWKPGDKTLKPGENIVGKVYKALGK
jgi:peroxiredoxin (alkyl hydroperoxide reductase subunit C)